MNIGIDIDDTISNTYEVQFNLAQYYTINTLKRDGKIKELNNLTTHFYTKYLHDWNDEEEKQFFTMYYRRMLEEIRPKMYAKEVLDSLKEEGNNIYLITARFDWNDVKVEETTKIWLNKFEIPYDRLIINAQDKAMISKQYNIDIFIDDSYLNCEKVANTGIKTYLMDSVVNRGINEKQNIQRVYSCPHVYKKIKEEEL